MVTNPNPGDKHPAGPEVSDEDFWGDPVEAEPEAPPSEAEIETVKIKAGPHTESGLPVAYKDDDRAEAEAAEFEAIAAERRIAAAVEAEEAHYRLEEAERAVTYYQGVLGLDRAADPDARIGADRAAQVAEIVARVRTPNTALTEAPPDVPGVFHTDTGRVIIPAGRISTVYGETGHGKTHVLLLAIAEALRQETRILWWDLDGSAEDIGPRLVAMGLIDYVTDNFLMIHEEMTLPEVLAVAEWVGDGVVVEYVKRDGRGPRAGCGRAVAEGGRPLWGAAGGSGRSLAVVGCCGQGGRGRVLAALPVSL